MVHAIRIGVAINENILLITHDEMKKIPEAQNYLHRILESYPKS